MQWAGHAESSASVQWKRIHLIDCKDLTSESKKASGDIRNLNLGEGKERHDSDHEAILLIMQPQDVFLFAKHMW